MVKGTAMWDVINAFTHDEKQPADHGNPRNVRTVLIVIFYYAVVVCLACALAAVWP